MSARGVLSWTFLAVAGLVLVAAVSIGASRLSVPRIGLSSEPLTEGTKLAPRAARHDERVAPHHSRRRTAGNGTTPTAGSRAGGTAARPAGGSGAPGRSHGSERSSAPPTTAAPATSATPSASGRAIRTRSDDHGGQHAEGRHSKGGDD